LQLNLPVRTARLILRDFEPNDLDAVHGYASDPVVTRYMFYGPRTVAETHSYLERMLASQREQPRLVWELGVLDVSAGRVVGACDLTLENPGEADLGFIFSREVWGRGYATEVAQAMVRAGFDQLGLSRIFSTCDVENHASARVLEKAGLRRESTLEKHKYARDQWWTSFLYSVRRDQWSAE
jgi:ribosomal-protein-alanine N-acetyltransferase